MCVIQVGFKLRYLEVNDAWKKYHLTKASGFESHMLHSWYIYLLNWWGIFQHHAAYGHCSPPKVEVCTLYIRMSYLTILLAVHHLVEALLLSHSKLPLAFLVAENWNTFKTMISGTIWTQFPYFPVCRLDRIGICSRLFELITCGYMFFLSGDNFWHQKLKSDSQGEKATRNRQGGQLSGSRLCIFSLSHHFTLVINCHHLSSIVVACIRMFWSSIPFVLVKIVHSS